jgi:hypothetical protein
MALPLPTLTFYRLPDGIPATSTISGLLNAVYNSLTSSTDYRGTALPSTHLWTWATASDGATTVAVYNTTVPTGSGLTTNFSILMGGTTASVAPTFATPDSYVVSGSHIGIVKNPGAYSNWISAAPMTTGIFSGFWRMAPASANNINTRIRSYVSEESIFIRVIVNATTQYWFHAGANVEPYTSYLSGSCATAEPDDRLLGMFTGYTAIASTVVSAGQFPSHTNTNGSIHAGVLVPNTNNFLATGNNSYHSWASIDGEKDLAGNWIVDTVSLYKVVATNYSKVGQSRSLFTLGKSLSAMNVIRSGSTDLYHTLLYNTGAASECLALKAAP